MLRRSRKWSEQATHNTEMTFVKTRQKSSSLIIIDFFDCQRPHLSSEKRLNNSIGIKWRYQIFSPRTRRFLVACADAVVIGQKSKFFYVTEKFFRLGDSNNYSIPLPLRTVSKSPVNKTTPHELKPFKLEHI